MCVYVGMCGGINFTRRHLVNGQQLKRGQLCTIRYTARTKDESRILYVSPRINEMRVRSLFLRRAPNAFPLLNFILDKTQLHQDLIQTRRNIIQYKYDHHR